MEKLKKIYDIMTNKVIKVITSFIAAYFDDIALFIGLLYIDKGLYMITPIMSFLWRGIALITIALIRIKLNM